LPNDGGGSILDHAAEMELWGVNALVFSAYWIRLVSDLDTTATATLIYR
jgi:hypothetical protein